MPKELDYAADLTPEEIAEGRHRRRVGRKWHQMGKLQLEFMKEHGLEPGHTLLDVGCGALRAGRYFVKYLDAGNYYGIDINRTLLQAGRQKELGRPARQKLPKDNLRATDRFECDFGVAFDFAIAQSVFTHVSLNHVRLCMAQVADHMASGGKFYVTFFEAAPDFPINGVMPTPRGRYTERNPFWYYLSDLEWAAGFSPWDLRYIGDWKHPVGQMMVELTRR